jgi:hypothetical protein
MLVMTPRRPVKLRTEVRAEPARPARRPLAVWLGEPITNLWAAAGVAALLGAYAAARALEPAPVNPDQPDPWFVALPKLLVAYGMLAAFAGLLTRRRWGMAASLLSASIATTMVLACPISGHHHFGLWWAGELACLGAWAAISVAGLRSRAAPRE